MKKNIPFYITTLCVLVYVFIRCSSGDNEDSGTGNNTNVDILPDTEKLLTNIYENGILKDYATMIALVEKQELTLKKFQDNPTPENLEIAIEEDKQLNLLWEEVEVYRLQLLRLLYSDVQFFPINTTAILDSINAADSIDSSFFDTLFDPSKGLLANTYLLNALEIKDFEEQSNYSIYLIENLAHIKANIIELQDYWKEQGDSFILAQGRGLDQSINRLVNVYINLLETIKLIKLQAPLSSRDTVLTESPYNDISIQLIQSNLKALKTSFNGDFQNSNTSYGFDDYLNALDREDLTMAINNKIDDAFSAASKITSLNNIVSNNSDEANNLVSIITELLVLFKVDVSSALDIIVTFTDNDGD